MSDLLLPNVYYFNPTCDITVGNDAISYTPPRLLQQFQDDLSSMPLWLAQPDDYILVPHTIDESFLRILERANISCPSFIQIDRLVQQQTDINHLMPWGWSMATHHYLDDLKFVCSDEFLKSPNSHWTPQHKLLYSRLTSIQLADALRPLVSQSDFIRLPQSPIVARSRQEVEAAIISFRGKAVIKAPWSSSGRGVMMIDEETKRVPDFRWVEGSLKQQGFLVVESFLDKVYDLSFHYWVSASGDVDYLGHNFFQTNEKGKFTGCILEAYPSALMLNDRDERLLSALKAAPLLIAQALETLGIHQLYVGPIGVDALWYRDEDHRFYLNPVIEVNVRHTMGLLNIRLRGKLHPNAQGEWFIDQFSAGGWDDFCNKRSVESQLFLQDGLLKSGFLPLIPVGGVFGAWLNLNITESH